MENLTIGDITIDVIRKDIKNIHLAVYPPTGRVRIAVPIKINQDAIRLFAISKIGWIKRHQRKFESQERVAPREFKERESHYFKGKRYLLKIVETTGKAKVVCTTNKFIELHIKPGATTEKLKEILNQWYRGELKKQVAELIFRWEKVLKVKVADWQIKQMKTKWGSCNIEAKRIWINLELAKKPEICLEYIIVHEMVHLLERHHNENFIFYMDKFLPNWKQLRTELNRLPVSHVEWGY